MFGPEKGCNVKEPGDLIVDPLTHLNLAFVNFGSDFKIQDQYSDLVTAASFLKINHAGLRVSIAVGGWTFNDPPTAEYFSLSKNDPPEMCENV